MIPLLLVAVILGISQAEGRNFGHERVVDNLLQNYGESQQLVRPQMNTTVSIQVVLHSIVSFDDKTGRLTGGYWLRQSWVDERLGWEDESVEKVRFPVNRIWKPDLRLWNSIDYDHKLDMEGATSVISQDGSVSWVPPAQYSSVCTPGSEDNTQWDCELKFGSWTHNGWEINLQFIDGNQTKMDVMYYKPGHYGWEVVAHEGELKDNFYACCAEPYTSAIYTFSLKKMIGGVADSSTKLTSMSLFSALFVVCIKYLL